ncbi:hypothetical protein [Myceligenerans crystallogenes]|uniref:ABC-2 family transporter protein n=1 Tax=Myceligenerans crystallogenes TaxID=316335 RepID=A0ABN2NAY6_9MICO
MNAVAQTLEARRARTHRAGVRAVERRVVTAVRVVGVWYWPILAFAAVLVAVLQWRLGALEGSTVEYVLGSVRWFGFSLGVILPMALIRPHLAAGGTRRALLHGLARGAAWTGLIFGLVIAVLYLAEQLVWGLIGWDWHRSLGISGGTGPVTFGVNLVGEGLVTLIYFLLGTAVAAGFTRLGPWLGLALCLLLGIPALIADIALYAGPATALAEGLLGMTGPMPVAVSLGALGVLAVAVYLVVRQLLGDLPVKQNPA